MSKAAFDRIMEGIEDAGRIVRGEADPDGYRVHVPRRIDVAGIRARLGLTQAEFSARFGISLHTLRKWEQDGREPEGPARAYLTVIDRNPDAVLKALGQAEAQG